MLRCFKYLASFARDEPINTCSSVGKVLTLTGIYRQIFVDLARQAPRLKGAGM
jgi:hypothetical protein